LRRVGRVTPIAPAHQQPVAGSGRDDLDRDKLRLTGIDSIARVLAPSKELDVNGRRSRNICRRHARLDRRR
jgi:hypothetical protein